MSLIMDFVVIDDRDWRIFTEISKSKKYLVLRCGGTNTHPLSLESQVLRSVVCCCAMNRGLLSSSQSHGFIQRNRETKTRHLSPQLLGLKTFVSTVSRLEIRSPLGGLQTTNFWESYLCVSSVMHCLTTREIWSLCEHHRARHKPRGCGSVTQPGLLL